MKGLIGSTTGVALAGFLAIAGGLATPNAARAAAVDLTFTLDKDGMSSGTCAGSICPTSLGTVTITGDTTSSLTYTVSLASGVSFQHPAGPAGATDPILYFDLTGGTASFSALTPTGGTNFTYGGPTAGTFSGLTGNFPGPYNYDVTCTQSAPATLCGTGFKFTVTGGSVGSPFVIGSPDGGSTFSGIPIAFVGDLSIAAGTAGLCTGDAACTGLVGTNISTSTVPEPSTWVMMILGFAGLGYAGYRKTAGGRMASIA